MNLATFREDAKANLDLLRQIEELLRDKSDADSRFIARLIRKRITGPLEEG